MSYNVLNRLYNSHINMVAVNSDSRNAVIALDMRYISSKVSPFFFLGFDFPIGFRPFCLYSFGLPLSVFLLVSLF